MSNLRTAVEGLAQTLRATADLNEALADSAEHIVKRQAFETIAETMQLAVAEIWEALGESAKAARAPKSPAGLRTKRRYAHELYPQAGEWETRALEIEVPALYARALGMDVFNTGWFRAEPKESCARTCELIHSQQIALMADAMHQGLTRQEAWEWASNHQDEAGEWVYERAVHYGVNPEQIKPYPCGPTPDHHDHLGPDLGQDWQTVTRAEGTEETCPDCTEPIPAGKLATAPATREETSS